MHVFGGGKSELNVVILVITGSPEPRICTHPMKGCKFELLESQGGGGAFKKFFATADPLDLRK